MKPGYHHAAIRFGHGTRLGETPPGDVLAWLDAQTRGPGPELPSPEGRDAHFTVADGLIAWHQQGPGQPAPGEVRPVMRIFFAERRQWLTHLLISREPFRDRLTSFWMNHLTVSEAAGYGVTAVIGPFLREAIRPHVGGRFTDMLLAAAHAPAMLYYLDQVASVGPNSPVGRRSGRGLNENFAREILELHTLSPEGGYTQQDVTEFARVITGWGVERNRPPFNTVFRADQHEPGPKRVLGRTYPEGPAAFAEVLRSLAEHPATHRHLARRLVQHFVADEPPPQVVARIEAVLRDTGGDLGAASRALLRLPEAWEPPFSKFRPPQDYLLALHRSAGATDPAAALSGMYQMAQPLWHAPQPNGWSDRFEAWCNPGALMQRLDHAHSISGHYARLEPMQVLDGAFGPLTRAETLAAVRSAGSRRDALSLIFASPEMQRR